MNTIPELNVLSAALLNHESEWPDVVEIDKIEEARVAWSEARAESAGFIITGTSVHAMFSRALVHSWINVGMNAPLPIGREAFQTHPYLKNRYSLNPEVPDRLSVLPGNEYLHLPVACDINNTHCEALFLAELTASEWIVSKRVAYRISGYFDDPTVERFIRNTSTWWSWFAGKKVGRPSRPTVSLLEAEHLIDRYLESIGPYAKPSLRQFLEKVGYFSSKTWERRTKEWGKTWTQLKNEGMRRRQDR